MLTIPSCEWPKAPHWCVIRTFDLGGTLPVNRLGYGSMRLSGPDIMGPPAAWLVSDEAAGYTGNRIIAANWDAALPGAKAAAKAGRAIGWPELGADAVWLKG